MNTIDEEMLSDFLDEASELLETIEEDFLAMENQESDNSELVNRLFRAVHTIKGTSGFLGLINIGKVSHAMETLLSFFREEKISANKTYIDALLKGADMLKQQVGNISESEQVDISVVLSTLLELNGDIEQGKILTKETEIASDLTTGISTKKNNEVESKNIDDDNLIENNLLDKNLVKDFIFESYKYLENLEVFLENAKKDITRISGKKILHVYNSLKAISGTSSYIGLNIIFELSSLIENKLFEIYSKKSINTKQIDLLLNAKDKLQELIDDAFNSNTENIDKTKELFKVKNSKDSNIENQNNNSSKDNKEKSEKTTNLHKDVSGKNTEQESKTTQASKKESAKESTKESTKEKEKSFITPAINIVKKESLRVSVNVIDQLMRLAGELVLVRNQEMQIYEKQKIGNREVIQRLDAVTSEIQETIMQTRLQPLNNLFNKFNRVVRDLGDSLNKHVELKTSGAEVELDKTILEQLAGPMTHLIRNSVDHGIESPQERENAGKPKVGTLHISAAHEGGIIVITLKDDGAGINLEKVKTKALSRGLVSAEALHSLSKNEILNFIFLPGLSTNEKISNVSGRGVGMDVVKTAVEKLSGSIEIDSVFGEGTSITLKLPLTLAILPSLVVACREHVYAIPQVNLEILVSIPAEDVAKTIEKAGSEEIYRLRDTLLPLVRLDEVFARKNEFSINDKYDIIKKYHDNPENNEEPKSLKIAILSSGNRKFGLVVDNVVGAEEIVVNQMHPAISNLKIYSGSAIMGDGSIALILDTQGIANHAKVEFNLKGSDLLFKRSDKTKESVLLLYNQKEAEQFAISLPLIRRIVEVEKNNIETMGSKEFVNIDNTAIRVVRLNEVLDVVENENKEIEFLILLKHINKPIGLLVSSLKDILDVSLDIGKSGYVQDGLLGSDIIEEKITLFLDVDTLMRMAEPEWFKMDPSNNAADLDKSAKTIMVVDDSSIFRQLISKYLKADGYNIKIANDGKQALAILENTNFDLLVSDIEMPVMNGYGLISELRASSRNKNIPAMALSSLNTEEAVQKAYDAGFNEYEVKLERRQFLKKVENILFFKEMKNERS